MIKRTLSGKFLPLMLSVMITTVFMNIYKPELTPLFGILAFVLHSLIFVFYDYFSTKGTVGKYGSILGGFAVIALLYFMATSGDNSSKDGIDFMLWFISSRNAVEDSEQYVYTLFVGICFFVASTVYYFTQVRYRIFVTFLILMIPFAIYAKEDEHIPVLMLLALLVLYLAVMIHCRQTAESENSHGIRRILDSSYKKSAAVFVFAVSFLSFAIPKPSVEANREYFESMIEANTLTQYLLSLLGDIDDVSSGGGFSGGASNRRLFFCNAQEPMNMKSKTFSIYDFENDVWFADTEYDRTYFSDWEKAAKKMNPADLESAVYTACGYDKVFAGKYKIKYKDPKDYDLSVYTRSITLIPAYIQPIYLLSPNNTVSTSRNEMFSRSANGGIISYMYDKGEEAKVNYSVSMTYYSDMLSDSEYARGIMNNLNIDEYGGFLDELYSILRDNDAPEKYLTAVEYYTEDYRIAMDYYRGNPLDINTEQEFYKRNETDSEIKKGDYHSPDYDRDISRLAADITKNCGSDIEKAEAIERYFYNNDYVYDLDFQKSEGANVKEFLFETHTGVCYEYCTAMVLLARAAGLPARYNEGFMMDEYDDNMKMYYITANNSHAFPEVYISGYGWLGFEPTISSDAMRKKSSFFGTEQGMITMICIGALAAVLLGVLIIYIAVPALYERYFRHKLKKSDDANAAVMTVKRLRKLANAPAYVTADEFARDFMQTYKTDISEMTELFNACTYGGKAAESRIRGSSEAFCRLYEECFERIKENNGKLRNILKKS